MDPADFAKSPSGRLVDTIAGQKAFLPNPLPPKLDLAPIHSLLSKADQSLGELRGLVSFLSNPYILIRPLQRAEAIASSNIEGTYTSLADLLLMEAGLTDAAADIDAREVFNYIRALNHGVQLMESLPLSQRLILALHEVLMEGLPRARTGRRAPGVFRQEQNFIGRRGQKELARARFVPPPPPMHLDCLSDLERFMNREDMGGWPPLVFAALIHYQFETIHPFPDGNGRVGRLLIPISLTYHGVLTEPILFISPYIEENKELYIDLLYSVSARGAWLEWLEFFLNGVVHAAENANSKIKAINALREDYLRRCAQARSSANLIRIVDYLFERPVITIPDAQEITGTTYNAAKKNVEKLIEYEILAEPGHAGGPRTFFMTELLRVVDG